jgi:hypothetical protein
MVLHDMESAYIVPEEETGRHPGRGVGLGLFSPEDGATSRKAPRISILGYKAPSYTHLGDDLPCLESENEVSGALEADP